MYGQVVQVDVEWLTVVNSAELGQVEWKCVLVDGGVIYLDQLDSFVSWDCSNNCHISSVDFGLVYLDVSALSAPRWLLNGILCEECLIAVDHLQLLGLGFSQFLHNDDFPFLIALRLTAWNYFHFLDFLLLDAVLGVKSSQRSDGNLFVWETGGELCGSLSKWLSYLNPKSLLAGEELDMLVFEHSQNPVRY